MKNRFVMKNAQGPFYYFFLKTKIQWKYNFWSDSIAIQIFPVSQQMV